ncbi:MAG: hypothetical protein F4Y68_01630 [Boseongicola sp. SB0665_bin_10]|nr:hypothetical protein [Boseongicola sp. SB0665_bin_10]
MIADDIAGLTPVTYLADAKARVSVEREFRTIGDSLACLARIAPELVRRMPDAAQVTRIGTDLAGGQRDTDLSMIWEAAVNRVPELRRSAMALLAEMEAAASHSDAPSPFELPSPFD